MADGDWPPTTAAVYLDFPLSPNLTVGSWRISGRTESPGRSFRGQGLVELITATRVISRSARKMGEPGAQGFLTLGFLHAIRIARQCRCQDEYCSGVEQCVKDVIYCLHDLRRCSAAGEDPNRQIEE
jgi:hypothetical protein